MDEKIEDMIINLKTIKKILELQILLYGNIIENIRERKIPGGGENIKDAEIRVGFLKDELKLIDDTLELSKIF